MTNAPYQGAYSRRRFSNYSDTPGSSGRTPVSQSRIDLTVQSANPSMGEVVVDKLTEPSPLSTQSSSSVDAGKGRNVAGNRYRVKANAFKGYRFVGWQTNLDGVTTQNPVEFTLTKDTKLVAMFALAAAAPTAVCTAKVSWNGKMGRVNGNGLELADQTPASSGIITVSKGSSVTLTASPLDGYHFVQWHGGPVEGKTSKSVTFSMNANYSIGAEFAANDPGTGGGGGGNVIGGDDEEPAPETPAAVHQDGRVMAFVKKWWWAILIVAYVILKKEGGKK